MATVPANNVTQADIEAWYVLKGELAKVKSQEMMLRKKIFGSFFPSPKEGTNSQDIGGGWVIKGGYTLNRDFDRGQLDALGPVLFEQGIPMPDLVTFEPKLVLRNYRLLTAEQKLAFDEVLIIKPGTASLDIVMPAKNKAAAE